MANNDPYGGGYQGYQGPANGEREWPPVVPQQPNFGRHSKTCLIHLTTVQLPPSPFTRQQSVRSFISR